MQGALLSFRDDQLSEVIDATETLSPRGLSICPRDDVAVIAIDPSVRKPASAGRIPRQQRLDPNRRHFWIASLMANLDQFPLT
jgi:hypothetical protein